MKFVPVARRLIINAKPHLYTCPASESKTSSTLVMSGAKFPAAGFQLEKGFPPFVLSKQQQMFSSKDKDGSFVTFARWQIEVIYWFYRLEFPCRTAEDGA